MTKQHAIDRAVVKITTVAESVDIPPVQRGILAAALRDLIDASSPEPEAEYCPVHPDVRIVVRPSTSVNGGSIGWGCAVCNCLEVERLRGFVSDEERSASIDRARKRTALNRKGDV